MTTIDSTCKMPNPLYQMMVLDSSQIVIPRSKYQRKFNHRRAKRIAKQFDERVANEPKVSFRNGVYTAMDGQHTITVRKNMNGGEDLPILCKVYMGLTEEEEALLFAKQTGDSAPLSPGERLRAEIFGQDEAALAFLAANAEIGLQLDYDQKRGQNRISCIQTALNAFKQFGADQYKEAMQILMDSWGGEADSFRVGNILGITHFVSLYHGEYDPRRLINNLRHVDPLTIYREGLAMGVKLTGYKRYLYQVLQIYNISGKRNALPMKF